MRSFLSTLAVFALTASALPAAAASIDKVHGVDASQPSILSVACSQCPPPVKRERKGEYRVPTLPEGGEFAEVIQEGETRTLRRIENMMGGSPVVVMSSANGWETRGSTIIASRAATPNEIDSSTTTAAVIDGTAGTDDLKQATIDLKLK